MPVENTCKEKNKIEFTEKHIVKLGGGVYSYIFMFCTRDFILKLIEKQLIYKVAYLLLCAKAFSRRLP